MLFRHLLVLTLIMSLLSSCVSIAAPSKPSAPPAPRPQQEKENAAVQETKPPAQQTDSEADTSTESSDSGKETEFVSVAEESNPPEIPLVNVLPSGVIQQEVPHASLEDRLPESRTTGRKSRISDQVQFLLLSPHLGVHSAEGEAEAAAVPTESVTPKSPEAASSGADSNRSVGRTDEESAPKLQVPERTEKISGLSPTEQKPEQKTEQKPEKREELIRAEPGEQVRLTLPGLGWIYDRGASSAQGVVFQSRSYKDNSTEFVFIAQSLGRYTLSFQQQDSSLGTSSFRRVAVNVDTQTAPGQEDAQVASSTQQTSIRAEENGFSFNVLEENISSKNPSGTEGQIKALLRSSLESGVFTSGKAKQHELALLVEAGEFLFEARRESSAEQALRLYLDLSKQRGEHTGRVLFLLGQIYESPAPPRDERQSAEYYRKIVSFYPTDPYRQRAEQRIKYLQRHFLQIR